MSFSQCSVTDQAHAWLNMTPQRNHLIFSYCVLAYLRVCEQDLKGDGHLHSKWQFTNSPNSAPDEV